MKESCFPAIPDRLKKLGVTDGDWFTACKDGLRWLMRPGMPLKMRVSICLILHSQGYNNELAMMQVQKQAEKDQPLFVPLAPYAITTILQKFAIEQFRRSKIELDDEHRKQLRVSRANMRTALEELEQEDGTVTRVRANCEPKKLIGLTFDEAMAKTLVTPIGNLTQLERKKLNQRSFIYVHTRPRPATKTALMRRTEDDVTASLSQASKAIHAELDGRAQLAFKFLRAEGINDPVFAAELVARDDMRLQFDEVQRLEERRLALNIRLKESVHLASEQYKLQRPSAALNPNGEENNSPTVPFVRHAIEPTVSPDRRAAEQSSVGRNSNDGAGIEMVAHSTARTSPSRPADQTSAAVPPAGTKAYPSPPSSTAAESPQPRKQPKTAAEPFLASEEDVRIPDAEFKQALIATFVDAHRPHPLPGQIREVMGLLPDHAWARRAFLDDLLRSMPRIKTPGVLPGHARGFIDAWPRKLETLEAERAEEALQQARSRDRQNDEVARSSPAETLARTMRWVQDNPQHHASKAMREEIERARTQTPATYVAAMQLAGTERAVGAA